MGSSIHKSQFSDKERKEFNRRLRANLTQLQGLLAQPGFGVGPASLGSELELSLVDNQGGARWINQSIIQAANDPQLTIELNRYNLEYNLSPVTARGRPFEQITNEIQHKLAQLHEVAAQQQARTVTIGILPTLVDADISQAAMSDFLRYRVLSECIKNMRAAPFQIHIEGAEQLVLALSDLNAEGANTSFQVHLRVNPDQFSNCYNAAQLASAPGLAIATNSPIFLGHRLWEETRIPLFKQAVETRKNPEVIAHRTARTGLGSDWVRGGADELFRRSIDDFPVLLPQCSESRNEGPVPALEEMRLHHGTIWHWNRAIYDPASGGHLRIELRVLPSGPTPQDMAASAAFLVGLTYGLSHRMPKIVAQIDFNQVKTNFYRAAQFGLDAELLWPMDNKGVQPIAMTELIAKLLPVAQTGLDELEVDRAESTRLLQTIAHRLERKVTGARWQLAQLARLERQLPRTQALIQLLEEYMRRSNSGVPLHQWSDT